MIRLVLSRLVQLPLILAVIFVVTFTLAWVLPGNPLLHNDRRPPPEVEREMLRQYHMDSPWSFAGDYLKKLLLHGDMGPSLRVRDLRVQEMIARRLPVSVTLGAAAMIFALFTGLAVGIIGAVRPGTALDLSSLALALVGVSLPIFVTGAILLIVFAGLLRWLPVGGWGNFNHMILPAITLGLAPAAYIARLIRLGLADVLSSDFIRTARAKGVSNFNILRKHALKIAFLPVLSFLGPAAAGAMTGSFVVEVIFNIPGLGKPFVDAVLEKDQTMILGIVLVYSAMLVGFNLIVDVAYAWVDPRIEL